MIYNYLLIAFRNLLKNLLHTSINVWGLAFGMASVFLITLYIKEELSYDKFHHNAEDLYRIAWIDENSQTRTPHPMAQALVHDFPEVESAVSLSPLFGRGLTKETHSFHRPDKKERYDEQNLLAVDTTFFDVFDFPIVKGDAKAALRQPGGLLISESMAHKYFGDDDAVGKFLAVDSADYLVQVLAVFKDVPENAHFHFDFLVSYVREKSFNPSNPFYSWKDFGHYNYLRLKHGSSHEALEGKLMDWSKKYLDWSDETYASMGEQKHGFELQPVTDIHLHSKLHWELEVNGNADYVFILGAAGLFTLLIGCVNFMNLSTAKSVERAKEIGVRKTMGAFRHQLAMQFLSESIATALVAALLSILIIELCLPAFNILIGHKLVIHYIFYFVLVLFSALVVGVVSGIYPAIYLSGVKPHAVLKGRFVQSPKGARFRKILMIVQFTVSMVLISSSVVIYSQLSFLQETNLGFVKDQIVVIPIKNEDGINKFDALRNELLSIKGVKSVSAASNIPGHQFNQHAIGLNSNPNYRVNASESFVDFDFFAAMDIQLVGGRTFSRNNPADKDAFVVNESAATQLQAGENVLGKELLWHNSENGTRGTIIGVVKDFHFQSLHEPIRPLIFRVTEHYYNYLVIKVASNAFLLSGVKNIEQVYKEFEPTFAFEYQLMDDELSQQYQGEVKTARILTVYSGLALTIACFGLFGMSMMLFHQKSKEVSIRKILGASIPGLMKLLLTDFTRLVLISIIIGTPVTWYMMSGWLNNFSYQVGINPMIFVASGLILLVMAWGTLSYFTVRATRLNPVDALKSE